MTQVRDTTEVRIAGRSGLTMAEVRGHLKAHGQNMARLEQRNSRRNKSEGRQTQAPP